MERFGLGPGNQAVPLGPHLPVFSLDTPEQSANIGNAGASGSASSTADQQDRGIAMSEDRAVRQESRACMIGRIITDLSDPSMPLADVLAVAASVRRLRLAHQSPLLRVCQASRVRPHRLTL